MDNKKKILETFASLVSPGKVELYQKYDLVLVPGKRRGIYIYDIEGKRYVNCHSNGGVFNLGHRNPLIIKAVTEALKNFDIGNHHLVSAPKAKLARMIADTLPEDLNQVIFGVSGGEAVDCAIKLARGVTGRKEIISAVGGYHGHTGFALATGDKKFKKKFGPMAPGFIQVPFNDIKGIEKRISDKTAAVIFETIPATMGVVVPDKDYYKKVRGLCDRHGALLIIDEIQTGFGRTGKMWGFEHFNFQPDIVTLGKGMSGGIYPISATVYNKRHAYFFKEDPFMHISTFGGSEVGCFAAMEVIRISKAKPFLSHVKRLGDLFNDRFIHLSEKYPSLGLKPRGMGLMMGLEFKDELTSLICLKLFFDNGIYVVYSGNDPKVLQFLPVLIITEKESELLIGKIDTAFSALKK